MTSKGMEHRLPRLFDESAIVSWVHFGDLHMTARQEHNYRDFLSLIEEVNRVIVDSLNFLPGDNADHGRLDEYELVRQGLDQLNLPWSSALKSNQHLTKVWSSNAFRM
jgi:Icc protein